MSVSSANILSLSDDVLLYILKQLDNLDVLYSFIGVNKQLDRVARDVTFTRSLDFAGHVFNEAKEANAHTIFERFCSEILPRIQHLVQSLTVHPQSIDRVLSAGSYPQLRQLIILNVRNDMICTIPNGHLMASYHLRDRISNLTIVVNKQHVIEENNEVAIRIFADLPIELPRLTHLQLDTDDYYRALPSSLFEVPSTICWSSTVTHLDLKLATFDPCLSLLNGRLTQLHTLNARVRRVDGTTTAAASNTVTNFFSSLFIPFVIFSSADFVVS